jgi:hypothetical protein
VRLTPMVDNPKPEGTDPPAAGVGPSPPPRHRLRPTAHEDQLPMQVARRLYIARRARYATASEAARDLGVSGPTYLAHENGTRGIRTDVAEFYALKFDVSTDWLLYGRGSMNRDVASTEERSRSPLFAAEEEEQRVILNAGAQRSAAGEIREREVTATPVALTSARAAGGVIFEIEPVHPEIEGQLRPRLVDIGVEGQFAIGGVVRIPLDMVEHRRLFAVRVARNDLLPDMPGGQRAYLDPDDRTVDAAGLYMVVRNHQFVPVLLEPAEDGFVKLRRSRLMTPTRVAKDELDIVGRIVMKLCQVTDLDIIAVGRQVPSPA